MLPNVSIDSAPIIALSLQRPGRCIGARCVPAFPIANVSSLQVKGRERARSEFLQREREKARKRGAAAQDLKKTGKRQAKAGRAKRRGKAGGVARSDFDEPPEPPAPLAELPGAGFVTLTTVLQFLGGVSRKTLQIGRASGRARVQGT